MPATRLVLRRCVAALCLAIPGAGMEAATISYPLTESMDSVFGSVTTVTAETHDTLPDIARRYSLGYFDIKLANPDVDTWLPGAGTEVVLPTEFVLPLAPKQGIVLNIPEMRLYYFGAAKKSGTQEVMTFPIGIGREGWGTPYVSTRVTQKHVRPSWYPPESIRREHAAEGDPLPVRVGPGPDNPLGDYAMRLGLPQYLIHGTNKPWGVGMRVSHGCIRLYPEDIASLFPLVKIGTPVRIVNQPYKIGLRGDRIFLEAHPFLEEDAETFRDNLTPVVKMVVATTEENSYEIDWQLARDVIQHAAGVPVEIGRLRGVPAASGASIAAGSEPVKPPASRGLRLRLETGLRAQGDD